MEKVEVAQKTCDFRRVEGSKCCSGGPWQYRAYIQALHIDLCLTDSRRILDSCSFSKHVLFGAMCVFVFVFVLLHKGLKQWQCTQMRFRKDLGPKMCRIFGYLYFILDRSFHILYNPSVTSHSSITNVTSYTGCPRRNGQNFGRVFLTLNYTDITQNTYIQS